MNGMTALVIAYLSFAGLIGGYTWHMIRRLLDLHQRLDATEAAMSNPSESETASESDE